MEGGSLLREGDFRNTQVLPLYTFIDTPDDQLYRLRSDRGEGLCLGFIQIIQVDGSPGSVGEFKNCGPEAVIQPVHIAISRVINPVSSVKDSESIDLYRIGKIDLYPG
jgi:hypothetical protein